MRNFLRSLPGTIKKRLSLTQPLMYPSRSYEHIIYIKYLGRSYNIAKNVSLVYCNYTYEHYICDLQNLSLVSFSKPLKNL